MLTPLRIAVHCRTLAFGAGGMEKTAIGVANEMAARGHVTGLFYDDNSGRAPLYATAQEVQLSAVSGTRAQLAARYRRAIEDFAPDVILMLYASQAIIADFRALASMDVPIVLHEGSNPERIVNRNWAEQLGIGVEDARRERIAVCAAAARVRVTLPSYRQSFPEFLLPDVVAFPNAFPTANDDFRQLRAARSRRRFINIGGLKAGKNLLTAVRAFASIADRLPEWDFVIFSAVPKNRSVLEAVNALIEVRALEGRLIVSPPTSTIYTEYAKSDIHVIPSLSEGLPNCIAEAMRHAVPTIGFARCPGTNEVVQHQRNGLLVDGEDLEAALAEAMLALARDEQLRESMGENAFADSEMFDPDTIYNRWEALLGDAAGLRPRLREYLAERLARCGRERENYALQQQILLGIDRHASRPRSGAMAHSPRCPKVSFIIPMFNKVEHVAETFESVARCEVEDKEVIIVDDCSKDGSSEIAEAYCERYGWKLVRHEQNAGLSISRNTGLDHACGTFIQFWDADDCYSATTLGKLIQDMEEDGADITTAIATRDGNVLPTYRAGCIARRRTTFAESPQALSAASVCFKIYRRSFLEEKELRFTPKLRMQDSEFNLRALPLARCINMSDAVLGEYRYVENSGTRDISLDKFESALCIADATREFYREHWLHRFESVRQQHILTHVLFSFLRRAGKYLHGGNVPCDLQFRLDFLTRLRGLLADYVPGIRAIAAEHPIRAMCYASLLEGQLPIMDKLLVGPSLSADDVIPELPFEALSREVARRCCEQLGWRLGI